MGSFRSNNWLQAIRPIASSVQFIDEPKSTQKTKVVALLVVAPSVPLVVDAHIPVVSMNGPGTSDEACARSERSDMVLSTWFPFLQVPLADVIFPPYVCFRAHRRFHRHARCAKEWISNGTWRETVAAWSGCISPDIRELSLIPSLGELARLYEPADLPILFHYWPSIPIARADPHPIFSPPDLPEDARILTENIGAEETR